MIQLLQKIFITDNRTNTSYQGKYIITEIVSEDKHGSNKHSKS